MWSSHLLKQLHYLMSMSRQLSTVSFHKIVWNIQLVIRFYQSTMTLFCEYIIPRVGLCCVQASWGWFVCYVIYRIRIRSCSISVTKPEGRFAHDAVDVLNMQNPNGVTSPLISLAFFVTSTNLFRFFVVFVWVVCLESIKVPPAR